MSRIICLALASLGVVADSQFLRGSLNDTTSTTTQAVNASVAITTPCWAGLQTVEDYTTCLSSVPLDVETRDCTLQVLAEQLRELYTYSSLVRNSTNNDAELAPGYSFEVYNITLGPYIDELWPRLEAETSAGIFALRITELFTIFQDAHTSVKFKMLEATKLLPPVVVAAELDENQEMQFRVVATRTWAPANLLNKTISSVNGMPALEYFLSVASLRAMDKSRGAQLNRFLLYQYLSGMVPPSDGLFNVTFSDGSAEQLWWMVRMDANVCGLGGEDVLCSKEDVELGSCPNTSEVMRKCFDYNPEFDQFVKMMSHLGRPLQCTLNRMSSSHRHRSEEVSELGPLPGLLAASRPDEKQAEEVTMELAAEPPVGETFIAASLANLAVEDEVGSKPKTTLKGCACKKSWQAYSWSCDSYCCRPDKDPNGDWCILEDPSCAGGVEWDYCQKEQGVEEPNLSAVYIGHSCTVLKAQMTDRNATVLKIKDFSRWADLKACAEAAVSAAAEASGGDLIVDVISNGGGSVTAGYALNQYLYEKMAGSPMKNGWDSCEWYDLPKTEELTWLVGLTQTPLPRLEAVPEPREHMLRLAGRMRRAVGAFAESPTSFDASSKVLALNSAAECLEVLVDKFATPQPPSKPTDGQAGSPAWREFHSLYDQCVATAKPFGGGGLDIGGNYMVSNKYPDPVSAPTWDFYTSTVTKIRGGEARNFSSMAFLGGECQAYRAVYPEVYGPTVLTKGGWPNEPQRQLRHVTYLSDGLCGSTCSVASTAPYLDGLTTFVTFGGVKGEALDITSFNGGNVGTYQAGSNSLWKVALSPAVDAGIFFPESKPDSWPFTPIPMNLASLRFAQRAEYPRALGPKALPREWYTIPASYHLDVWTNTPLTDFNAMAVESKRQLYNLYASTAALPPKPFVKSSSLFVIP